MYSQPVEVEIGEHQGIVAGGGTYRHVTIQFPNGRKAYVGCRMTADGRAELHVGTYEEEVRIYAFDQLCAPPA